ncbi:phosphoribosylglycinamide formyltransferase [Leptolyngbya cf. ectocarpi LEGE 11479]|uniref:Phosphoribosylglycinamide formyltransferase n=1 Tax=Leptolyngbya cf. ectocarpi LEGE 11479 TaxID=1828722 RepID=A0A928X484_LEPEC|nr:phosphoribosylglycinamide formyltransferase [Leptolyngbya ectocarpi]MBE9066828.1 phosphoribosylglycinamide formyltransferase [Leptolyngbya cf. ectocarpi LEGE 11479]
MGSTDRAGVYPSTDGLLSPNIDQQTLTYSKLSLGVLASGNGSNFEAIMAAIDRAELNAEVKVVICNNPGANVLQKATHRGIRTVLLNHREFESRVALDQAIVSALTAHGVDWVIMAGWMRRVTEQLISAFTGRLLNIHPSLLPSFPGLHAVRQALEANVTIAGCTVHHVELVVDSGPIIMQAAVPVLPTDTEASLQARIQVQEHQIYPAAIALAAHHQTIGPSARLH